MDEFIYMFRGSSDIIDKFKVVEHIKDLIVIQMVNSTDKDQKNFPPIKNTINKNSHYTIIYKSELEVLRALKDRKQNALYQAKVAIEDLNAAIVLINEMIYQDADLFNDRVSKQNKETKWNE
jgi:hypothetical protein